MAREKASKDASSDILKKLFEERGLSRATVAAMAGIKRATLQQQLAKGVPRQRLRLVMETVVDAPVWSSPDEFIRRKALKLRLAFDPHTVRAEQLRRQIPGLKIKGWKGKWRRQQLIELLEQKFLAAKSK
jgi:hypothetical protein